jgi:ABC-type taurine transport system substrate-binding protein
MRDAMYLSNDVPSGKVGAASTAAATVRRMRGRSFMLWRRAGDCEAVNRESGKKLLMEMLTREFEVWER